MGTEDFSLRRSPSMIRAVWNGAVLAEAARTVRFEGNDYFPPEAVRRQFFTDSSVTSFCPWKRTDNSADPGSSALAGLLYQIQQCCASPGRPS
jgi:hypothetical protein